MADFVGISRSLKISDDGAPQLHNATMSRSVPTCLSRHPLRGLCVAPRASTGSQTHPWLYAVTPFGVVWSRQGVHGCAYSPVALCRHPLRGLCVVSRASTGARTHPWLYA